MDINAKESRSSNQALSQTPVVPNKKQTKKQIKIAMKEFYVKINELGIEAKETESDSAVWDVVLVTSCIYFP